jgi:hypothetical protein
MQTSTYQDLSVSILDDIFGAEKLPKNGANRLPLFSEMHLDLLAVMLKMPSIKNPVYNRFTYSVEGCEYHVTFSISQSLFQSTKDAPVLPMFGAVKFNFEGQTFVVDQRVTDLLVAEAVPFIREANLDIEKYKSEVRRYLENIAAEKLSDADYEYYIGQRPVQEKVRKMQKVQFSVVQKFKQKFFAIFLYSKEELEGSKEKFFDYGTYFSFLGVTILPEKGVVTIFRHNQIFDVSTVKHEEVRGDRGPELYPIFAFNNSKIHGRYSNNILPVSSLELGDIVEIDWELNPDELKEIQRRLDDKKSNRSISPEQIPAEVRRCFVKRIVLKDNDREAFSLFVAAL